VAYASTYSTGYSSDLASLGGSAGTASAAGLIDGVLAGGSKSGYVFTYQAGQPDKDGRVTTYTVRADPVTPGTTGMSHYFTDETMVIRVESDKPADSSSTPTGG